MASVLNVKNKHHIWVKIFVCYAYRYVNGFAHRCWLQCRWCIGHYILTFFVEKQKSQISKMNIFFHKWSTLTNWGSIFSNCSNVTSSSPSFYEKIYTTSVKLPNIVQYTFVFRVYNFQNNLSHFKMYPFQ